MAELHTSPSRTADRPTARIGWNNRVQTVTIPVNFRFPDSVREVYIRKEGDTIVLTPRPHDWTGFFASADTATPDFMADIARRQ
jgi:antitoxin VapB